MRKLIATAALAAFAFSTVAAGQAQGAIDHELTVARGETASLAAGDSTGGTTLAENDPENCSSGDNSWMCERVLVEFTGTGDAALSLVSNYPSDFDVEVYSSDKNGSLGELLASSGNFYFPADIGCDPLGFVGCGAPGEAATWSTKKGYALVIVYYFAAGGGYTLDVSLS